MTDIGPLPKHPVLYSFRRCPFAMRARLTVALKGLSVELREVVLRDKPAHMIALSAKATVPVLWLPDGRVVDESRDIMLWAWRQSDPAFAPTRDDTALIDINDTHFKHSLDRYKYSSRYPGEDAMAHRSQCVDVLRAVELRLAASGFAWLGGETAGFADMAILPFVRQFRIADESWFDTLSDLPRVRDWLQAFLDWPLFQLIMRKYKPWRAGETGNLFPAES